MLGNRILLLWNRLLRKFFFGDDANPSEIEPQIDRIPTCAFCGQTLAATATRPWRARCGHCGTEHMVRNVRNSWDTKRYGPKYRLYFEIPRWDERGHYPYSGYGQYPFAREWSIDMDKLEEMQRDKEIKFHDKETRLHYYEDTRIRDWLRLYSDAIRNPADSSPAVHSIRVMQCISAALGSSIVGLADRSKFLKDFKRGIETLISDVPLSEEEALLVRTMCESLDDDVGGCTRYINDHHYEDTRIRDWLCLYSDAIRNPADSSPAVHSIRVMQCISAALGSSVVGLEERSKFLQDFERGMETLISEVPLSDEEALQVRIMRGGVDDDVGSCTRYMNDHFPSESSRRSGAVEGQTAIDGDTSG